MVAIEYENVTDSNLTIENATTFVRPTASYSISASVIIRTIGVVAFVLNTFAFVYIIRLWKSQKRENTFYIQLAFVCANDVGCGFVIILMSIPVHNVVAVYVCGFSHIILNVLVCMAQGNIFFICLQRYIFARNIRATSIKWKALLSKTLLGVNIVIGFVVLTINLLSSPFYEAYRASACSLAVFTNFGQQTTLLLFYIGLPTMLASDVFCCLAIMKLANTGLVAPADRTSSHTCSSDQENVTEGGTVNFKKSQKTAIVTVILILISFNLSTIPNFLSIFLGFFKISFGLNVNRLLLFCIFGNSLANPVIYVSRMQSLRSMVAKDTLKLKHYLCK